MSLGEIVIPRKEVVVGEGSFQVRGLSSNDITTLLINHQEEVELLFELLSGNRKNLDDEQTKALLMQALAKAPATLATGIALAADEPDMADKALTLDMSTQIDALLAVWELTVAGSGGTKKFLEKLTTLAQALTPQ